MTTRYVRLYALTIALLLGLTLTHFTINAADWPGFLGPNRDGLSPDKGLLKQWPEAGPKLLWKVNNVGPGWSSMAIVNNRLYTTGNDGDQQVIICLDLEGNEQWRASQGPKCNHRKYGGARSTPTIDGNRLYVTGGNGSVTCHQIADGKVLWQRNMKSEMGGKVGGWQYAESVLIFNNLAIVTPGGRNAIVALNKMTGRDVWKSDVSATAGYSSCMTITEGGNSIIVNGSQSGLLVVDAKMGKRIHKHDFAVKNTANVPTPAYVDGLLFWGVGYGKGSICLEVEHNSGQWSFQELWRNKDISCHPGNYVVANGFVYGKGRGGLACVELKTGETQWKDRVKSGQVSWADGMLYVFSDSNGQISLVDPAADTDRIKGSFSVEGTGRSWSHPVIIGGRLFLRFDTCLNCYDVRSR